MTTKQKAKKLAEGKRFLKELGKDLRKKEGQNLRKTIKSIR